MTETTQINQVTPTKVISKCQSLKKLLKVAAARIHCLQCIFADLESCQECKHTFLVHLGSGFLSYCVPRFIFFSCSVISGPENWAESFPIANGPRQSPIDIVPTQAQHDPSLKQLKLKYDPATAKGILNNGHSFQVDFTDDDNSSSQYITAFQELLFLFSTS